MQIECTGRQTAVSDKLRGLAEKGAERIGKILGRTARGHVILTSEKHRHIAEVEVATRASNLVALCESTLGMEAALKDALAKAESQAVRLKTKRRSKKRQPKAEKTLASVPTAVKRASAQSEGNDGARARSAAAIAVDPFPSLISSPKQHVIRASEPVASQPMTIEEAVKEAEFRDHEVFVFRNNQGNVNVLHRKRDGKIEWIEVP